MTDEDQPYTKWGATVMNERPESASHGTQFPKLWAALAAPFPQDQLKKRQQGGQTLLYITARMAMNRLDEVVGPENWEDVYQDFQNGLSCRITIRLPDGTRVTKTDGGGAAGMKLADDDEKSAFSDAFKRCCVKFGIARYLYRDGVPEFVREELGLTKGGKDTKAPASAPARPVDSRPR